MEGETAKISSIEDFGVFLNNGGFIHITEATRYFGKRINSRDELESLLPIGTEVNVELMDISKNVHGQVLKTIYSLKGIEKSS